MPKKVKKISSESMFHQIARKECESHRALTGTNITFQPLIEGEEPGMALKYRMFCPYCAIAPDGMSAQATYQATVMDTKDGFFRYLIQFIANSKKSSHRMKWFLWNRL